MAFGVCINPKWVRLAKKELRDTGIKVNLQRVALCKKAKRDGADELDVVISIPDVKHERWGKILKDLKEISF